MENASKALIMAGSVLLSLLVIGALIFMFNSLSGLKTGEADSDEVLKLAEYNKKIETYNRDLYGSELISLANLIDDYNKREPNEGYQKIDFKVDMSALSSSLTGYMASSYTSYTNLIQDYKTRIENALNESKQTIKVGTVNVGKSAKDWAGMTDEQKDAHLNDLQTKESLNAGTITTIRNKMEASATTYSKLSAASNTFKNRKFEPKEFSSDSNTGRITSIKFEARPA